ncbi:hypothetical protein LCGC14_3039130, partial [marine sediment metagenome]
MKRKAFTLIEILIVVILLGILAALVVPQLTESTVDARINARASDIHTLQAMVQLYWVKTGSFPQNLGELVPDYVELLPNDPVTRNPYAYNSNTGAVSAP